MAIIISRLKKLTFLLYNVPPDILIQVTGVVEVTSASTCTARSTHWTLPRQNGRIVQHLCTQLCLLQLARSVFACSFTTGSSWDILERLYLIGTPLRQMSSVIQTSHCMRPWWLSHELCVFQILDRGLHGVSRGYVKSLGIAGSSLRLPTTIMIFLLSHQHGGRLTAL